MKYKNLFSNLRRICLWKAGFFYTTKAGINASFVTVQNHPDYLLHIHSIERLID